MPHPSLYKVPPLHPVTDLGMSLQEGHTVTCVFWKEGASQQPWGAWSADGCRTEQPSPSRVLCRCHHLTYFAVLMVRSWGTASLGTGGLCLW